MLLLTGVLLFSSVLLSGCTYQTGKSTGVVCKDVMREYKNCDKTRGCVCLQHEIIDKQETYTTEQKGCDNMNNCVCLHKTWGGLGSCDSCQCVRTVKVQGDCIKCNCRECV